MRQRVSTGSRVKAVGGKHSVELELEPGECSAPIEVFDELTNKSEWHIECGDPDNDTHYIYPSECKRHCR